MTVCVEAQELNEPGRLPSLTPRTVLIVSEDFLRRGKWAHWLRSAGFTTATCPGPHVTTECPRRMSTACPLREWARVAIVDMAPSEQIDVLEAWAEGMCTRLPDDGWTLFVHAPEVEATLGDDPSAIRHPITPVVLADAVRTAGGPSGLPG